MLLGVSSYQLIVLLVGDRASLKCLEFQILDKNSKKKPVKPLLRIRSR